MSLIERLRDYEYLVTDQSFRIETLESALREARDALELVKAYEKPFDDPYEDVCCAIDKINAVLGETK